MVQYGDLLWEPSAARCEQTRLNQFLRSSELRSCGFNGDNFADLYTWSLKQPDQFWWAMAQFADVKWLQAPEQAWHAPSPGQMRGVDWFPGGRLNFAENLWPAHDDPELIVSWAEGVGRRALSAADLRRMVTKWSLILADAGVGPGDRVAGVLINGPEAIIAMLATAARGAVWASCSPDFGSDAIVDRLEQIEPKVLFYSPRYVYNGKAVAAEAGILAAQAKMPSVQLTVAIDHLACDGAGVAGGDWLARLQGVETSRERPEFIARSFNDPVYILFSSGTTGVPKCIVHGVGGTLLQHVKELQLHTDLRPDDRLLYYTTCGWMMWNWMVSALAVRAKLVVYDGSPMAPETDQLWRVVADEGVTAFGTSPKFLAATEQAGIRPKDIVGDSVLRTILSTGAPLAPEQFAWVYSHVKDDIHLASISGGTDIVSCFMLGVPTLPVYAGEIQHPGLGMAVAAWREYGEPVIGEKGELVCTQPFPSMPVGFWRDEDGERYRQSYFDFYGPDQPEVWRHGDWVALSARGGVRVYGRSDATLNPGGVRIGTAEIYRYVESLPEVADSIAVGQEREGDTVIILFVVPSSQAEWSDEVAAIIRRGIKENLSPRHMPAAVVPVPAIPYTRSGKKVELAVQRSIHGESIANVGALANPEALAAFRSWAEQD